MLSSAALQENSRTSDVRLWSDRRELPIRNFFPATILVLRRPQMRYEVHSGQVGVFISGTVSSHLNLGDGTEGPASCLLSPGKYPPLRSALPLAMGTNG